MDATNRQFRILLEGNEGKAREGRPGHGREKPHAGDRPASQAEEYSTEQDS
ncbi:MAG: hypothetical protein HPY44_18830 [Armatimonadetes bacterium]|nr:hypothetical protein [Armatimonadota bacterium]